MPKGGVIIAGGSGFIGTYLYSALREQGYTPLILTRKPDPASSFKQIGWDAKNTGAWAEILEEADAVINLAGKSVDCRYNANNRREILDSRIASVNVIAQAIQQCKVPPKVWIQASSTAIYGNAGDEILDESSMPAFGFSPEVIKAWEAAFDAAEVPQTRKVLLRIGFALGHGENSALTKLARLATRFLGGTVGSGKQYMSWIHIDDLVAMFVDAIETPLSGMYHATGPAPVTNREFMFELRSALRRPWSPPVPALAVKLGCALMGTESELALYGRRCVPRRFLEAGFQFKHPQLNEALADLLR